MLTNRSDNKSTIKEAIDISEFDTWNDNKMYTLCNYRNEFIVPDEFILDGYKKILSTELIEVPLKEEFRYQPAAFSADYYGTPELDFLVMYFSGIHTLLDFDKPKIKVLPEHMIRKLLEIVEKNKDKVEESKTNPNVVHDTTLYRINGKFRRNIIVNGKIVK